ncbi:MAG: hypothetical protein HOO96_16375 [Polyangiaceae bacterium]|nr:hypothetical protein [Polyangiaceae bacterium]
MSTVVLSPGAEENGLACMLADLMRQNLEAKPHKLRDFRRMSGDVAIVAEDADVSLTLRFARGTLTILDGIVGVPKLTVRGTADVIMLLSNMPIRFGLPLPTRGDADSMDVARTVMRAMGAGELHTYGMLQHPRLFLQVTRVMSVNG